jgi:hypothetical protein
VCSVCPFSRRIGSRAVGRGGRSVEKLRKLRLIRTPSHPKCYNTSLLPHTIQLTTTIVGKIENENRRLIAESRELQDSQICRLLKESDEDRCNEARTFVGDLAEDLLAQQRRLFERGFKDTEQLARTLVLALDESMEAQQHRVLGMKQFIQQHKEGN